MTLPAHDDSHHDQPARDARPGKRPMSGAQRSFLDEKARQDGRPPVEDMTEKQATDLIVQGLPVNGWGTRDAASKPHVNGGEARRGGGH